MLKRILLTLAVLLSPTIALSQTWKPIVNLGVQGYCDSHNRCSYRTNSGNLYVLVNASPIASSASSLRIYKSTVKDPTSLAEVDAAHHPTDSSRFIGADGRLNTTTGIISIAYEPTATTTARYITFDTNTDLWGTSELIANLSGQDGLRYKSHLALALDAAGIPHVICGGANQGFFYTNRTGGTWSAAFAITANFNDQHPSLAFSTDGVLHLAWYNPDSTRSILYRERSAAGVWTATETVASGIGTFGDPVDQSPSIALDAGGLPLILYHEQADINADVVIKRRTAASTYADVSPPVAGPPSTGGHDWSITVTWNGDWIVCGHMQQNPVQPACKTRSNSTGTWGTLTIIASGVAKDGSTSLRYDPLYPGTTSTLDATGSDENSPPNDWFFNADITPQPPPSIFFLDLKSGPNNGGQNNKGTFLTIYGTGFGTAQGTSTVTVGGGLVDNCPVWGASWLWYQKITCQIGASAVTGNVVVTVGASASNCNNADETCAFTVRAGNILFVSTAGNDTTGTGTFAAPWRTMYKAKSTMAAGDIVYVRQGVIAASQDQFNSCFDTNRNGTPTSPIAFDVYPGETATIGGVGAPCGNSYRTIESSTSGGGPWHDWVIANFNVIEDGAANGNMAMDTQGVTNLRFIGNQIDCLGTNGGQAACWETEAGANNLFAYGNHLRQFSTSDKQWHGFYYSTNTNHVWVGWNSIHDGGCRGIQFHSTGAPNLFDLHVHDNLIYNIRCDGINMATVAPNNGPVEVYNNVIFHSGLGPDFGAQGASSYTCIASPGIVNAGSPGTGNMLVYNNSLIDCSSRSTAGGATTQGALGVNSSPPVKFNNNIIVTVAGDTGGYLSSDATTGIITGSNNECSGSGNCPASLATSAVNAVPGFVNTAGCASGTLASCDLHLLVSSSPANGAGTATQTSVFDHDGLIRPAPPAIGAFEFSAGNAVPQTSPAVSLSPTSLTFASQILATTSATQNITLTNTGTASLSITSITLTGANASEFSIFSNPCGASLSAGANCIVGIRFTPVAVGVRTASLTFTTNATTSPDNATLTGTGAQTDIYLAQAAAGTGNGASCANARAVSYFNASGNWGAAQGQIGSGITIHLCGTITSVMTTPASQGTGVITIKFETGAKMSQAAGTRFIVLDGNTNSWVIDGGSPCGNTPTGYILCNGQITDTATGSNLANQITGTTKVIGISAGNTATGGSVVVKNLEIGPLYQHATPINITSGTSDGSNHVTFTCATTCGFVAGEAAIDLGTCPSPATCANTNAAYNLTGLTVFSTSGTTLVLTYPTTITAGSGTGGMVGEANPCNTCITAYQANPQVSNLTIQDNIIHDVSWALTPTPSLPGAGIRMEFARNDIYNIDHGLGMGTVIGTPNSYKGVFHDNSIHDFSVWNSVSNNYHHDGIHLFTNQNDGSWVFYNNLFRGPFTGNTTAFMFIQNAQQNMTEYNDVFILDTATTSDPAGEFEGGGGPNQALYNNTAIQTGVPKGAGPNLLNSTTFLLDIQAGGTLPTGNNTFLNNISTSGTTLMNSIGPVYAANTATTGLDFNLYANYITNGNTAFNFNGTNATTLPAWRTLSGEGTHSALVGTANLDVNGIPQSGSPAIGTGANLTSLCVGDLTALCSDSTLGNTRFAVARPTTGSWNIGALGVPPVGVPLASLSAASVNFFNQIVGTTTSIPAVVILSNSGTATLLISSITFTGTNAADFGQSNNCGVGIAAGTTCTINITFAPATFGPRSATLNVNDNANGSPHVVTLTGNGMKTIGGNGSVTGTGNIKVLNP